MSSSSANKLFERVKDLDLYAIFGVSPDATEKEIKKAYRLKALKCHPDKNPDNPNAAKEFHTLSDAYLVLGDETSRKAYDQVLKAKQAHKLRNQKLDAKRKKLKDDLEAREEEAKKVKEKTAEEKLKEQLERVKKINERLLEEENIRLQKEMEEKRKIEKERRDKKEVQICAKLSWTTTSPGFNYDKDGLKRIFFKFGELGQVVIVPKGKGKSIGLIDVTVKSRWAVEAIQGEIGNPDVPIKVSLVDSMGAKIKDVGPILASLDQVERAATAAASPTSAGASTAMPKAAASFISLDDFEMREAEIFEKMRLAQERKMAQEKEEENKEESTTTGD